ncbi:dihydrolipoamide acetyltransferase family protein [Sandaracinus amylolyticus]|uniref:Dihydrolipoamide acetyltransferase component of pyruvate dehydrogenase complex n=1 Tax=Sandaracinus amylolyticus TaxID=927083 RepID=A0A0F6W1A4_9BACT|nr:dihydrolipoamide acetyltransferase family protein [Sandaracinus amylolyticus]AKF04861.1 Dihydrolipoamide acyltransferase [Sandaracinus amylolyticus]
MATTVVMPPLGESVLEGTVGKWLVQEGQRVERDQPVVEILTDKTDSEIPAPASGLVVKLLVNEGDTVPIGARLLEIDETASGAVAAAPAAPAPAAAPAAPAPVAEPASSGEPGRASPAVRKLAREMDVDLGSIEGTGQGGVVTREDVLRVASAARPAAAPARPSAPAIAPPPPAPVAAPAPAPRPAATSPGVLAAPGTAPAGLAEALRVLSGQSAFKVPPYQQQPGDKVVPFSRRRRIIADHMVYSKLSSPHVVTFAECDLHKTSALRDKHKDALKKEGVSLTFLAFVTAAVARALREYPVMNSRVLEDAYVQHRDVNLGIAVETDEGLVVPVIRKADELRVRGIARAIDEIATKSRDGKLTPDDLAGKTFSISNPGRKGNLVGGAIISQPNVGILRIGEIKKRVVVVENDGQDTIAIHPVMYMALSYDHRVVDGVVANGFLFRVNELLEKGEFEI